MISDVYSKHGQRLPDVFQYNDLPFPLRHQICWVWKDVFGAHGDHRHGKSETWFRYVHDTVSRELGLLNLTGETPHSYRRAVEEAFLTKKANILLLLDIVQESCKAIGAFCTHDIDYPRDGEKVYCEAILEINYRFRENGIGYEFVPEANRLIRMDSTVTHETVVKPVLSLLTDPKYKEAQREYLEAWDDYKKTDFDDCLAKCCSSFESFLKVACDEKSIAHDPKATAAPLIEAIWPATKLDEFFKQPLILIATMRNRISSAHGAGKTTRTVPIHVARYSLHATASALLLLSDAI